jgi:hypothetical protein
MGKKSARWPIWKIALATGGCAAAAVLLFWLSVFMGTVVSDENDAAGQAQFLTLPGFILVLGVAATMLAILCVIWLVVRIHESRIPPWERGKKKTRRR